MKSMTTLLICYGISLCARYSNNPREPHDSTVKQFGRYLKSHLDNGIILMPDLDNLAIDLHIDTDFAGSWNLNDPENASGVKSRTGFVLTFAGVPLLWKSTLQSLIALSSQESKYIACSTGMQSLAHL